MFQLILEWFTSWLWTPKHKCERCWCAAVHICEWEQGKGTVSQQLCRYHALQSLQEVLRRYSRKMPGSIIWTKRNLPGRSEPTMSISSAAEEPLRKEEQEEIDEGLRSLARTEPSNCAVRKLGVDAQTVYCGPVQLAAGQLLTEASVRGAIPRELGTITRIRVFTFDSFALRLGSYSSAELVHLRPDVYDCDSIKDTETHKVFQVLTTAGWFPEPQEDTTVHLSTR